MATSWLPRHEPSLSRKMRNEIACKALQTPTTDRSEINLTFTVRHTHICQAQHGSICVGVGAWPRGVAQEAAQADSWGVVQAGRPRVPRGPPA